MEQLKNINHSFDVKLGDVGVTIRKGTKWYDKGLGTKMELRVCPKGHDGICNSLCTNAGMGEIIGRWKGAFANVPDALMSIEHNIECRNKDKCREMMERGYGSLSPHDTVTALIYLRIK